MADRTAIWWIRRDLRLHDNPALQRALSHGGAVLPVFVLDPALMQSSMAGPQRIAFLLAALRSLEQDLRARGGRLLLRSGDPARVLASLLRESGAGAIFAEADTSPYARRRDHRAVHDLPITLMGGPTVHPPAEVCKANGDPYVVYTPYKRAWKERLLPGWQDILAVPQSVPTPDGPASEPFPALHYAHAAGFPASESAARQRLQAFVGGEDPGIYHYKELRDLPGESGTSRLSPYLRFGLLSAREVVVRALDAIQAAPAANAREGARTWLDELIWREFYTSILYHFPHVLGESFRPAYQQIRWREDEQDYSAWRQGRTGYPLVDAAMRELLATGWMHNRARMIAASFLVKNLLIHWQWGERWFMQHLLDGDPAANNGGWQWTAGTGTDAAPYFRVFNPVLQSRKFDPGGEYIRRWLPALARVPDRHLHAPWEMPVAVQKESGCVIGEDYPAPIVDLSASRQRALDAYAEAKDIYSQSSQ